MLHSIPVVAPSAPCFTLGRAARGRLTAGYAAFGSGDRRPLAHRLLPLNLPVLIVDFTGGRTLLTGPRDRSSLDGATTWGAGVSIGLTPLGATTLAGAPLPELSGRTVELELPWASRLAALPTWPARFARLDAIFARLAPAARWAPQPAVTAAWWRLQRGERIAGVAAGLGRTRRALERDFRREIGLSPGAVARTARLQRSLTALLGGAPPATAAATGGFADQPHLTRTMRDAVGLTPGAFRAFVQDLVPSASLPSGA